MAVIYCNRCHIGFHYIDLCPGGANGYPEKTKEQMRKEYLIQYTIAGIISAAMFSFIYWLVNL